MKTGLKAALFILIGCSISSFAQTNVSCNIIIGKWKLKSSWVKRSGKVAYMPISKIGTFVYEFKSDGTFISYTVNPNTKDADSLHGSWEIKNNGKALHLYNAFYIFIDDALGQKRYPSSWNVEMNIIDLSSSTLRLNGDPHYEEADSASLYLYSSWYTRFD